MIQKEPVIFNIPALCNNIFYLEVFFQGFDIAVMIGIVVCNDQVIDLIDSLLKLKDLQFVIVEW